MGLNDQIWGKITASVGNKSLAQYAGPIVVAGYVLYRTYLIVGPYILGYATSELANLSRDSQKYADIRNGINSRIPFRTEHKIFISDFNRMVDAYKADGMSKEQARLKVLGVYTAAANTATANLVKALDNYNTANKAVGVAGRELAVAVTEYNTLVNEYNAEAKGLLDLYHQKNNATTENERSLAQEAIDSKMKKLNNIQIKLDKAKKKMKKKKEKDEKKKKTADEKKKISDKAEKDADKAKADKDQAEEAVNPKKKKSCALMSGGSEDCNSGVSPAGMANVMNSMPKKLLREIDKKIRNIPPIECNIVTRSCGSNSVEPTAEEMKQMFDNINASFMSDDGGCTYGEEGCSIFGNAESSGVSYINQLWGPLPEMGQ